MKIPYGISCLFISCFNQHESQFRSILRLACLLKNRDGFHHHPWTGLYLNLSRRQKLTRVLISGHGSEASASYSCDSADPLIPARLRLPPKSKLYLVGCYQGCSDFREHWAAGTGVPVKQIWGSDGETESALSTCLLLHLLEEGPDSLDIWFPAWVKSNAYLRPHFPLIRRLYRENEQQPLLTLEKLGSFLDLAPVDNFIQVCRRHPEYMEDLLEV